MLQLNLLGKCFAKPKPQNLEEKARIEYTYYRINHYHIATVEEARHMSTSELALANEIADEFENQQEVRMHNAFIDAISDAFGGSEE